MFQTVILGFLILIVLFVAFKLYLKFTRAICKSRRRLEGSVAIVTGSNSGIGFETAKDLARRGAKVILACRDIKRAEIAAETIRRETRNRAVVVKKLDLGSLTSVRSFCNQILKEETRLDILVNNAGVAFTNKIVTDDGLEGHLATNHLGPFLLTNLLLGLMIKTRSARIVNLSSLVQSAIKTIDFDNINSEKEYQSKQIYAITKLYNIMFTTELNRRIETAGQQNKVTVNAVHPGIVKTELFRHAKEFVIYRIFLAIVESVFMTACEGAQTSIFLAVSEEVEGVSGLYWSHCKNAKMNRLAEDEEQTKKLWEASAKLVKLQPHEYHL